MRQLGLIAILALLPAINGFAQEGSKTLASTLDVFVFPADGQAADQQSRDEVECYDWAVNNTGNDPFDLTKQGEAQQQQTEAQVQQAESASKGSGLKGAAGGAVAGAIVGEIVDDDAGKGAAIGAVGGGLIGRRRGKMASAEAQQQAQQEGQAQQQATAEQIENFKKAFSVCLEAKDYMVKY